MCFDYFPGEQRAAVGRAQPETVSLRESGAGTPSDHGALEGGDLQLKVMVFPLLTRARERPEGKLCHG